MEFTNKKDSSWKRWFKDKGFYLAIAVCLLAVGGVAVITFMNASPVPVEDGSSTTTTTAPRQPATSATVPVDQIVTGVPDKRTEPPVTTPVTEAQKPASLFLLPLTNTVLQPFSDGKPVYSATMNDWRTHNGTDFAGEVGQDVKAIADGKIVSIEKDLLWGGKIVIDHGFGAKSVYCGVTAKGVQKGQSVQAGDVIAVLADIPCETADGAHLHLEVFSGDEQVDPVDAIGLEVKYVTTIATAVETTAATKAEE